jgi:hypothetical protein
MFIPNLPGSLSDMANAFLSIWSISICCFSFFSSLPSPSPHPSSICCFFSFSTPASPCMRGGGPEVASPIPLAPLSLPSAIREYSTACTSPPAFHRSQGYRENVKNLESIHSPVSTPLSFLVGLVDCNSPMKNSANRTAFKHAIVSLHTVGDFFQK